MALDNTMRMMDLGCVAVQTVAVVRERLLLNM